jgi:chromosome segregation ATPase
VDDLRTYLSETAQRELNTLRAALDTRLRALEKALAHPDPTESLESLIIDLARVASDEAHASAARKWLEAQASADAKAAAAAAAEASGGVHGALMAEAAALRGEIEEVRAHVARESDRADSLRRDAEAAQASLRDERATSARLDAELTRLRAANADFAEAVETLRGDLDAARKRLAEALTQAHTTGAKEAESGRAAVAAVQAQCVELERALEAERADRREQVRLLEQQASDAAHRADAAEAAASGAADKLRAAEAELSAAAERLRDVDADRARLVDAMRASEAGLAAETGRLQAAAGELEAEREKTRAADSAVSRLSHKLQGAEADLATAIEKLSQTEAGQSVAAERARALFDAARHEATEALAVATARVRELELQLFRREQAGTETEETDLGSLLEDRTPSRDRPIRRFSRYSFRSKMMVDIEGESAQLVDLSVGGAQVLSQVPLDLNREAAVSLVSDEIPVSGRAKVMWTRADPKSTGRSLRYRAGIEFTDVDPAAVEAYIIRYSST